MQRTMVTQIGRSPFDDEAFVQQAGTYPLAQITLKFDRALEDGPARAARAFELLRQFLQERGVAREPVDNGHRLAAAAFFLDAQFRDNPRRDPVVSRLGCAAAAIAGRPP